MRKSEPIQWVFRVLFYVLGLFVMALGVAIAANSNLGMCWLPKAAKFTLWKCRTMC